LATAVIMPKTGMAQETGTIVRWFYEEGDRVEKGEPLLEVMTDKVNMDVEAPASGILTNIKASPDDVVPVTEIIAYIAEPGEEVVAEEPAPEAERPLAKPAPLEKPVLEEPSSAERPAPSQSSKQRPARVRATPMARRLAKEHEVDLSGIEGSGPGGAITKADVLEVAERPAEPAAPRPPAARTIPLVGRRRIIGERMVRSVQEAPHIAVTIDVDMSEAAGTRGSASYTALLVHVVSRTLREHPLLNSTLRDGQIELLYEINIGVATTAEEGLIVPVIKQADSKSLQEIDAELKELANRARAGNLTLDDVSGGTFTISNLGMFGIPNFRAIINPPEAAILAVGAIIERPVVINGGIHIRPMMSITASADHRILDGVAVARFLQDLKAALEVTG
jgi:pyruvate dehydrogenase E2 component (dihydrolipoamide acetyltransferase)